MAAELPKLVCLEGSLKGKKFVVSETGLTIGRAEDNNVVLLDDGVSRYHASLTYDNGSLWLRDAGSRNGVVVNGESLLDHKALKAGDQVEISGAKFEVRWESEDAPEEAKRGKKGSDGSKPWYWPFG